MYALLVQLEVGGTSHQATFESVEESEIIGLVVDGVWMELVPVADGDGVRVEIDLYQARSTRWGFRTRPVASPHMLLPKDTTGAVSISDPAWTVKVTVGDTAEVLPEFMVEVGELEVGIDGPKGPGRWVLHDPSEVCVVWERDTLVCPSAGDRVGVEVHRLQAHRRGWSREPIIVASTSEDVLHGNSASGDYALDVHWVRASD